MTLTVADKLDDIAATLNSGLIEYNVPREKLVRLAVEVWINLFGYTPDPNLPCPVTTTIPQDVFDRAMQARRTYGGYEFTQTPMDVEFEFIDTEDES